MQVSIYVISVKTFVERHHHIEKLSKKFNFDYEFIWRYDADALEDEDLSGVCVDLAAKSASNVLKHLEAQRLFLFSTSDYALILEDDVILFDKFFDKLNVALEKVQSIPAGWLLFLGGGDNKQDSRFIQSLEMDLILSPITTAEAYIVDRVGCEKRMHWMVNNKLDRQADHQLKVMDHELGISHYCVSIPMATQGSITGQFSTSLDASRSRHGRLFLSAKYSYNRLRRQLVPRLLYRLSKFMSPGKNGG